MSALGRKRWWSSSSLGETRGLEYSFGSSSIAVLCQAIGQSPGVELGHADFLLVPIAKTNREGVHAAISAVRDIALRTHVCLMLDEETLGGMESADILPRGVGIGLDGVTSGTSLRAMIAPSLEAVRFEPGFVAAASDEFRLGAVLQAMVSLANDLGLRTLGPALAIESSLRHGPEFDYVSSKFLVETLETAAVS